MDGIDIKHGKKGIIYELIKKKEGFSCSSSSNMVQTGLGYS